MSNFQYYQGIKIDNTENKWLAIWVQIKHKTIQLWNLFIILKLWSIAYIKNKLLKYKCLCDTD